MKTKNILIVGIIGLLGFLYWKNKKKPITTNTEATTTEEETSGSVGGGGFMGGGTPLPETPSEGVSIVNPDPLSDPASNTKPPTDTPTSGGSVIAPDPLADAQAKALADAQAKALADQVALANEAQVKAISLANNLAQAKAISNTIQININKRNGYKKASSVRGIQAVIDADTARLRALGYIALPNGGVQPI